jgi:hypothetical protein
MMRILLAGTLGLVGLCGGMACPALAQLLPPSGFEGSRLGESGLPLTSSKGDLSLRSPAAGLLCRAAIAVAERSGGIPSPLMAAIARVESGRPDAQGGVHPWPWTINAQNQGHFYATKAEAITAARQFLAQGIRSMDVGCMQVNLAQHPDAFASLDQAFDPLVNAVYAARFLKQLFAQSGDWGRATAAYHSQTPGLGAEYERKVALALPQEQLRLGAPGGGASAGGNVWSSNVWSSNVWSGNTAALAGPAAPLRPADMLKGAAGGGFMLSNRASSARLLAAPRGTVGRGLAAYRATPVSVSGRALPAGFPLDSAARR